MIQQSEPRGIGKDIKEILDRICPTDASHRAITKHSHAFCARCGSRLSDLPNKERKECEE